MKYTIQHLHPDIGLVTSATTYDTKEAAQADCDAGNRFTNRVFTIIPMQTTIPITHRTHKQKVKDYLLTGLPLDRDNMFDKLGERVSLAARVQELKYAGMKIDSVVVSETRHGKLRQKSIYTMSPEAIEVYCKAEAAKALTIIKGASDTLKKQLSTSEQSISSPAEAAKKAA